MIQSALFAEMRKRILFVETNVYCRDGCIIVETDGLPSLHNA